MALTRTVLLVLVAVVGLNAAAYPEEECYSNNNDPYLYFGTKTAYSYVAEKRGREINVPGKFFKKYFLKIYSLNKFLFRAFVVVSIFL